MKYYVEFWTATGAAQRESTEPIEPEEGMTVAVFDIAADARASYVWNPDTHAFEDPALVPAFPEKQTTIPRKEFLRDVLGPEALAATLELQKTDTFVEAFRMLLFEDDIVHLDDPLTLKGVAYLKSKGITIANPGAF